MNNEEILKALRQIETDSNIHILYAAETGSRAWGFASPDSDWDVRFIYVHPLDWYLSVTTERDVVEVVTENGLDAVGWDIKKALSLFGKTNPTSMEWLYSPIKYIDNIELRSEMEKLIPDYFSIKRALLHYFHVALNHQNRYLEKRGSELKRYLYYIRSLLACKWLLERNSPPPVPFKELICSTVSDNSVLKELEHILALKSQSKEHDKEIIPETLIQFGQRLEISINSQIADFSESNKQQDFSQLNSLLRESILTANHSVLNV